MIPAIMLETILFKPPLEKLSNVNNSVKPIKIRKAKITLPMKKNIEQIIPVRIFTRILIGIFPASLNRVQPQQNQSLNDLVKLTKIQIDILKQINQNTKLPAINLTATQESDVLAILEDLKNRSFANTL